jgi:hypothetical protein
MVNDSEEKILKDWNDAWSKPPLNKLDSAKNMHYDDIQDLYRKVLKFARMNGNPATGKAKRNLRESQENLSRSTGNMFLGKFGLTYAVTAHATTFQQRTSSRQNNEFKIMAEYLNRIRHWKAQKHSTK